MSTPPNWPQDITRDMLDFLHIRLNLAEPAELGEYAPFWQRLHMWLSDAERQSSQGDARASALPPFPLLGPQLLALDEAISRAIIRQLRAQSQPLTPVQQAYIRALSMPFNPPHVRLVSSLSSAQRTNRYLFAVLSTSAVASVLSLAMFFRGSHIPFAAITTAFALLALFFWLLHSDALRHHGLVLHMHVHHLSGGFLGHVGHAPPNPQDSHPRHETPTGTQR